MVYRRRMRTARFFVPPEWIARAAQAFSIPAGPFYRQIVTVLRMKAGDVLSLCPNDGSELECTITEITKSAILGSIGASKVHKPLRPRITVCAAITKRDTFEWMLQKCTELGVCEFVPMFTDRVVKKTKEVPSRWCEIVREASEQSGRTIMPSILDPMSFSLALEHTKACERLLFHESAEKPTSMPAIREMDKVALFIGPEGGFTDEEVAEASKTGAAIVQLGSLVFRAETAAIVATTLVRFGK